MEESYDEIFNKLILLDPTFEKITNSIEGTIEPSPSVDIYTSLLHSIVSQQLSTKVAEIIWQRFLELFPQMTPDPIKVLDMSITQLRSCGLSNQKAQYIKNVAQFTLENNMSFESVNAKGDQEIIDWLTEIKGVGKWTVQMILMFPLNRLDVFPLDDLGIQTKMKYWYRLDTEKAKIKKEMEGVAAKWRPYRSIGSKLVWASVIEKT